MKIKTIKPARCRFNSLRQICNLTPEEVNTMVGVEASSEMEIQHAGIRTRMQNGAFFQSHIVPAPT
jgi:hypothetical protein